MYIQAPDVCWNKPFKVACSEKYDEWLGTVGIYEKTAAGNLKATPGITILQWVLDSRAELPTKVIKKSLSSCALNLPVDGSKDDMIHCLKEGQPCNGGRSLLRSQSEILSEPHSNPFECTSSDVKEAYPTLHLLDSDHKEDGNTKIEWTLFTLCTLVVWTCKSWNLERWRKWRLRKPLIHVSVFKN